MIFIYNYLYKMIEILERTLYSLSCHGVVSEVILLAAAVAEEWGHPSFLLTRGHSSTTRGGPAAGGHRHT
jgi:hypothetical protein